MQNADTVLPISLRRASADALRERNFKGEHFSPVSPACGRNLCLRTPVKTQAWREVCKNQVLIVKSPANKAKPAWVDALFGVSLQCSVGCNIEWSALADDFRTLVATQDLIDLPPIQFPNFTEFPQHGF